MINKDIKKRIEQINSGQVPEGYKKEHGFIAPGDWDVPTINKILKVASRPIAKPQEGYWRLGLRSHAKGTFHTFVDDPSKVAMDELYKVKENDLVLNITFAWEHAIAIANKEDEDKLVSHRFPTYEFKPDSIADFYKYIIVQPKLKDMLCNISPGGAGRNRVLNKSDFLKLNLPKPPKEEQKKIAEILLTCDRVINLKQNLLTEKQNQRKWLMQELFSGKENLKKIKLADLCTKITKGTTPSSVGFSFVESGITFVKIESILENGNINSEKLAYITEDCHKSFARSQLKINDILFSIAGALGRTAIVNKEILPANLNQAVAIIRLKHNDDVNMKFVFYFLRSNYICNYIKHISVQGAQSNLSLADISNIVIELPSPTKQKAIAEILSIADKEINLLQKETDEYKQLKKSFMQLLLTGVVRVNELDINKRPEKEQEMQAC